jgi:hypothetical protein
MKKKYYYVINSLDYCVFQSSSYIECSKFVQTYYHDNGIFCDITTL